MERLKDIEKLKKKDGKYTLYNAGLPNFPRNFTRDSIISGILERNPSMLKDQLMFCAEKQGKRKNPKTGEEPGKIHHEYPGLKVFASSTEYNACDTTALFLIGQEIYYNLTGDKSLIKKYKNNIERAKNYILKHLNEENLFIESPKFCGANKFVLKTTYWKDTGIISRKGKSPSYPVTYSLVHIQNMCALRSATRLLGTEDSRRAARKMKKALKKLFDKKLGVFYIAIDKEGSISQISSDSLHSLFYLNHFDIARNKIKRIIEASKKLETKAGYRSLSKENRENVKYRGKVYSEMVWPFEQAMINLGARKFNLRHVDEISSKVIKFLDGNPEMLILKDKEITNAGCNPQLWTIAAKKYFREQKMDLLDPRKAREYINKIKLSFDTLFNFQKTKDYLKKFEFS